MCLATWRTHTHRHTSTLSSISIVRLVHSVRQGPPVPHLTCPPPAPALAPTPAPHSSMERHAFPRDDMAWPARIKHLSSRIGRLYFSWLWASRWFAAVRGCTSSYQVLASPQGIIVNIPVTGIVREELESYRLRFQKHWDRKLGDEEEDD